MGRGSLVDCIINQAFPPNLLFLTVVHKHCISLYITDFGLDHLVEVAGKMNFPWLMSNVRDKHTEQLLAEGERKIILDWRGKKVSGKTGIL